MGENMGKRKITKKQEERLYTALSIDDVLYSKHLQLMEQVHREAERLIHAPHRIHSIIGIRGTDTLRLAVKEVVVTPEGTQIVVQL